MKQLFVARHARASVTGICYGHLDVPVEVDAQEAARRLRQTMVTSHRPRRLWTSPARRCLDVALALDAAAIVDERLREMHFGSWEGRTWDSIEPEPEFGVWARDWKHLRVPGGESAEDLDRRVAAWFDDLDQEHLHFAIAHAGVIRSLRVQIERWTWDDAMAKPVEHLTWIPVVTAGACA
jgi:alpha-ribazole phosphatase